MLNSFIDGWWGAEEKPSGYDFTPEKNYTVEFLATDTAVSISLQDKQFYDYKIDLRPMNLSEVLTWPRNIVVVVVAIL